MAISAAYGGGDLGTESRRSTRPSEFVTITGSTGAADETTTYLCRHLKRNVKALGGSFLVPSETVTLAGVTVTLKAKVALGNDAVLVELIGEA